jgi:dUTP pyrophosphatase
MPKYATDGSAGLDLCADIDDVMRIWPSVDEASVIIPTGVSIAIPVGYVGFLHIRSSVGSKLGLSLANQVGVIDSDYRGEIMLAVKYNLRGNPIKIQPKQRLAQLVIVPVHQLELDLVDGFTSKTVRGAGGFGSTG